MPDAPSDRPMRAALREVLDQRAAILDDAPPAALAYQRKRGRCTARRAFAAVVGAESFVEYGGLARPAVPGMNGAPTA